MGSYRQQISSDFVARFIRKNLINGGVKMTALETNKGLQIKKVNGLKFGKRRIYSI